MNLRKRIKLALTTEEQAWLFEQEKRYENINPCVRQHGPDKLGRKCKECRLFKRKQIYKKTYFKCVLRGNTNGPGTDHRANWPACAQFVPVLQRGIVELPHIEKKQSLKFHKL